MSPQDDAEKNISYKDTLNLPHTDFPIRAHHKDTDLALIRRWCEEQLFEKTFIRQADHERSFIMHDGPPYANGNIHLGHAYNKIIKDIICKAQRMEGFHVPITPGWDCHGLPIELKVAAQNPDASRETLKKKCREYAHKWIDIQREEFKSLGILFDWSHPYITMDPQYEASILRAFADIVGKGYIEKKLKTVAWCMSCKTVLATAEIEYQERKDPSLYVTFSLTQEAIQKIVPDLIDKKVGVLVWTTTPWTLPLNRAVLLKPKTSYQVIKVDDEYLIVGNDLVDTVLKQSDRQGIPIKEFVAEDLEGLLVQHPFIENLTVPLFLEHWVSIEEGTAFVHCAPGCGPQDYEVALKHDMPIFSPIGSDGRYTHGILPAELCGMLVSDAQGWVIKKLQEKNNLFYKTSIRHSYPHCWRCHNGLIFRATKQWFLSLTHNKLKESALNVVEQIMFMPPHARNFLRATIENRLEWCLSRQRVWGTPIPALLCSTCDYSYLTPKLISAVAQGVQKEGVEYWDRVSLSELDIKDLTCPECKGTTFVKEQDILDVWFDAGVSHYAVLKQRDELSYPADLYAEGVDQHRGWFQSSLLTSIIIEEKPCMKAIMTHGFTVDVHGRKMSKSIGNVVSPQDIIDRLGTDGLRLWASSMDLESDVVVSDVLLKNVHEVYRKIRNTLRFLLSNLYDFSFDTDSIGLHEMSMVDRYALEELYVLNQTVRVLYANAKINSVFHELADYCTTQLSSFYLDIIKDRLYCDAADGAKRRSAQTVCWYILDTLTKLCAPILSFTAELISDHYQAPKEQSIHLQQFNDLHDIWKLLAQEHYEIPSADVPHIFLAHAHGARDKITKFVFMVTRERQWKLLLAIRSKVLKAIEKQRELGIIKHSLEAHVYVRYRLNEQDTTMLKDFMNDVEKYTEQTSNQFLKELFIVSYVSEEYEQENDYSNDNENENFHDTSDDAIKTARKLEELAVKVERAEGAKCPRCWQYDVTDHTHNLCSRCQSVLLNTQNHRGLA